VTGQEAIERLGIADQTFDWAIPMQWADRMIDEVGITYQDIYSHFVWMYDEQASIFGRPFPLTTKGNETLARINAHYGLTLPLTPNAIPMEER
jgi:hypothetical protein